MPVFACFFFAGFFWYREHGFKQVSGILLYNPSELVERNLPPFSEEPPLFWE
jgi:hypothetical protein